MTTIFLVATLIYPECLGLFYLRALRSLGHEVEVWDPRTMSMPILKEKPDLTIVIKEFVDPRVLPNPRVYIFPDPTLLMVNFQGVTENYGLILDKIVPYYDHVFFCMVDEEPIMRRYGASLLPFACDPEIHTPSDLPKNIDVSFVGTNRTGRIELLKYLDEQGVKVDLWGNSWPRDAPNYRGEAIYLEEKRRIYSSSKIVLNHHAYQIGPDMRFYEALGYQCFMLSDKVEGIHKLGFEDGVHYVSYSQEDLVEKIRFYLESPDERDKIAKQGHALMNKHTYQHRVKELMSKCI